MKLKPPKVAAYWSCRPPDKPDVVALDLEGQAGDVVFAQRQVQPLDEGLDHRHHQRRRRAQARARRRVGVRGHAQRQRAAAVEVAHDAVVDALVQVELPVQRQRGCRIARPGLLLVGGREHQPFVRLAGLDHGVGVHVDGRVQDQPAVHVAVRRDVGAAAAEAESQGGACADEHGVEFVRSSGLASGELADQTTQRRQPRWPAGASRAGRCGAAAPKGTAGARASR